MNQQVYFLACEGRIKIGTSTNLRGRVRTLARAHTKKATLIGAMGGGYDLEGDLHNQFRDHHITGEWFEDAPELRSKIDALISRFGVAGQDAATPLSRKGQSRGRRVDESQYVREARDICERLIRREMNRGMNTERAIAAVGALTGIGGSHVWKLRYRPTQSVTAGEITALRAAISLAGETDDPELNGAVE